MAAVRERRNAELRRGIRRIRCESEKTCGYLRIHAALRKIGERVVRLIRKTGVEGVTGRRFDGSTMKREAGRRVALSGPRQPLSSRPMGLTGSGSPT